MSSSLSIFIIMFSVAVACEISPFTSTHSEPIRAAVLDSTHSMYQLEILGASLLLKLLVSDLLVTEILGPSLMLKLLVTDLWTLLCTILFIHLMWENSSLLSTKICSVLDVKSHLSHQHILSQLETAVLDSTHTMHKRLHQDIKMKSSSKHLV